MMDHNLFEPAVRLTAPASDTGMSWRPMRALDSDEFYVDGVLQGDVIRDNSPYHREPRSWVARFPVHRTRSTGRRGLGMFREMRESGGTDYGDMTLRELITRLLAEEEAET